jgi:hemoglobin
MPRLRRLKEQFCYILDAGCDYTRRTMQASHKDMGIQTADVNALIEDPQAAMRNEHVGFFAQNQFPTKLAPVKRTTVKQCWCKAALCETNHTVPRCTIPGIAFH